MHTYFLSGVRVVTKPICLAQDVDLSGNLLTGTLPDTLSTATQDLRLVNLANNSLTGPLPRMQAVDRLVVSLSSFQIKHISAWQQASLACQYCVQLDPV